MENTNLNDLFLLGKDGNKVVNYDTSINFLIVIDKKVKVQVDFNVDERESLRNYLNNLHDSEIQNKIKDNEDKITQNQSLVTDYTQQITSIDTKLTSTQVQMKEAGTNCNVDLFNQLVKTLADLQKNKDELAQQIATCESNIISYQKENEELKK